MTTITIVGRTTREPELRFTPQGKAVATFSVAVNQRRKNPTTGEWEDGEASFHDCALWGAKAEAFAEQLRGRKGVPVIVVGSLRQRKWEDREGQKRSTWEVRVDDVALTVLPDRASTPAGFAGGPLAAQNAESDPWSHPGPSGPQNADYGAPF